MENPEQRIRALLVEADRAQASARERAAALLREADMQSVMALAYRKALEAFGITEISTAQAGASLPNVAVERSKNAKAGGIPGGAKWAAIFERLLQDSNAPYSYTDLQAATSRLRFDMTVGAIRAQMMTVVNAGLFERISAGKFNTTSLGLELIMAQQNSGSPEGDPESGETPISAARADREANGDPIGLFS